MPDKVVVLHSGGLDSTVCLHLAKDKGFEVLSLGVDYGQRSAIELEYAKNQCIKLGVKRRVIKLDWDKPERTIPTNRDIDEIKNGVSPAFLPARNLVFLSLACAEASGIGANEVWIGVNSIDFSGYPDCREEFIKSFQSTAKLGVNENISIITPLQNKDKKEIAEMAMNYGLSSRETWSCYTPNFNKNGITPCLECDGCKLHEYAFRTARNVG